MKTPVASNTRLIDSRLLDKAANIGVRARMAVEGFINGVHRSPFHGSAVEFAEHRQYAPGDDTRHIDWKVQARTNRLFIKQYEEETNLSCTIVLDASGSMSYGEDGKRGKLNYAATLAASLTVLLQRQQDAIGLATFTDKLDLDIQPASKAGHLKQILHHLNGIEASGKPDFKSCLLKVAGQLKRRGIVVVISDLLDDMEDVASALRRFRSNNQEVIVLHVLHEDEVNFDFGDHVLFEGIEESKEMLIEPLALRKSYLAAKDSYLRDLRSLCSSSNIDYVPMDTSQPIDVALGQYLISRDRAIRRRSL